MTRFERDYRRIARRLGTVQLMAQSMDDAFLPDDLGLSGGIEERRGPRRFLDFYGDEGLNLGMKEYGLFEALEVRGYRDITVRTDADDERHELRVFAEHDDLEGTQLVVEMVVRRDQLVPADGCALTRSYQVLTLDWLTMRDPSRPFGGERPALPGQDAPGLGMGEQILEVLYRVVERLDLDALVGVADHFHNAVIYGRELSFLEQEPAARHRALVDALLDREELSLSQAAWAMEWGLVTDHEGRPLEHQPAAQVRAFADDLAEHLREPGRRRAILERAAAMRVRVDRAAFDARWAERALSPSDG